MCQESVNYTETLDKKVQATLFTYHVRSKSRFSVKCKVSFKKSFEAGFIQGEGGFDPSIQNAWGANTHLERIIVLVLATCMYIFSITYNHNNNLKGFINFHSDSTASKSFSQERR